jgi:hypothetical protein
MPGKRGLLLLLMSAFALGVGGAQAAGPLSVEKALDRTAKNVAIARWKRPASPRLIRRYRSETWRWQALTGQSRTQGSLRPSTRGVLHYWVRAAGRAYSRAIHLPHRGAWTCIHRYEGSWQDSGDPYWGGLQMDRGFMGRYAPGYLLRRGYADRWTPLEQMWVAERAYRAGRGFYPWPSTARMCGLI